LQEAPAWPGLGGRGLVVINKRAKKSWRLAAKKLREPLFGYLELAETTFGRCRPGLRPARSSSSVFSNGIGCVSQISARTLRNEDIVAAVMTSMKSIDAEQIEQKPVQFR